MGQKPQVQHPCPILAYHSDDAPVTAKTIAAIVIAYALSPADRIPGYMPVIGNAEKPAALEDGSRRCYHMDRCFCSIGC
jgi:hypothetical protein